MTLKSIRRNYYVFFYTPSPISTVHFVLKAYLNSKQPHVPNSCHHGLYRFYMSRYFSTKLTCILGVLYDFSFLFDCILIFHLR